ncbi:MAG: ATP-binding cassette domain-containing protein [Candidatus Latescibacteria bacterium]|nr:ATP-binding cassette domain-containing protein [Candidatus Latescibacterota bacterium]NIM22292.1 ATP-binding cassette domain-containing protein [Candidatus Latescibacterota bacterium]NIM65771.1 ATP-binding cassette domain-containing protein [Candidatus Latescibacterota bacterium]NIO02156.1 ATP-binding cassette domain-containing protein [Candidatus Latescibacterota bacterium]NIO28988.1 ATP-binding cassette domain-containing protein [Candidatus Latescibacterota bacterium]
MRYSEADEVQGKAYDSALMRRILTYLTPYKKLVGISIALLLLVSAFQLAPPYLVKLAIDNYLDPDSPLTMGARYGGLFKIAGVFVIVLMLGFAASYAQDYLMSFVGQRVMFDLRMQIFSHLQRMELSYFDKNPVGRLMTRLTSDVEVLNETFTSGVVAIFLDVFTLLGIMAVLCYLNLRLALITFLLLPLLFASALVFRAKVRKSYRLVRKRVAAINAFLQENITGMPIVQIFNRQKRQFEKFTGLNKKLYDAHIQSIMAYAVFFPTIEILSSIAIALILWFGGSGVIEETLTFGALVAFIQYAQRFYRPISDLSEKYNILQSAMASSERIFGLLDTSPRITDPEKPAPIPAKSGEVVFENVSFSYNPGEEVLHDVSFRVAPGEKVAIVGYTGAGKTTIINLLSRFYDVGKGRILIDGEDIRNHALSDLRGHVATVLQDVFLFSGDIAYNIDLGEESISEQKVREISRHINAEKFIERLPGGYHEKVGERGKTLSVGERQLLSFARALVYEPRILVLDEATSSVDTETEHLIQDAMKKFMAGRTSIVIAHRLSTIRYVDRIIVLHHGRIVEEGTHKDLLSRGGLYSKLYELQYKDQEKGIY